MQIHESQDTTHDSLFTIPENPMDWIERFTLVVKSSVTTLREKIEDPERMLHQLICDMEEELEAVRASVAAAIADEFQLGKQVERAREDADKWNERAEAAMQRDARPGSSWPTSSRWSSPAASTAPASCGSPASCSAPPSSP